MMALSLTLNEVISDAGQFVRKQNIKSFFIDSSCLDASSGEPQRGPSDVRMPGVLH